MKKANLVLVLCSIAFSLATAEVVLRLIGRPEQHLIGWQETLHPPHQRNQFGFRGHDALLRGEVKLILLGDSQVEATGRGFEEMPEVYLSEVFSQRFHRSVGVVTLGTGGYGQDQEYHALLENIQKISPRVVCLWLTPGNDFWNNVFPTHFGHNGTPKPTYWVSHGELMGPNLPWLSYFDRRTLYVLRLLDRVRNESGAPTDEEWEAKLPPAHDLKMTNAPSLRKWLADKRGVPEDKVYYFENENFITEKTHYGIYYDPPSPRTRYAVQLTRLLLFKIRQLAESVGARFFVFRAPLRKDFPEERSPFRTPQGTVTLSLTAAIEMLDQTLEGFDVVSTSLADPEDYVSPADSHLGVSGNRKVAAAIAAKAIASVDEHREEMEGR